MLTGKLPRVSIAHLPTPLEPLPRLAAQLGGPELWIKRDDQTGLATGGNKTRKLEFLVADALAQEADTLITCGAAQSNHARQTAAAAAKFGLACTLVLRGKEPPQTEGNLLLDRLLGAEIVWAGEQPLDEKMAQVAEEQRAASGRPYVVPVCFGYEGDILYFHSAPRGRKLDILRRNSAVCFEFDVDCEVVPAKSACGWSMRFRSVVGFGDASLVEDPEEKRKALDVIMGQYGGQPGEYAADGRRRAGHKGICAVIDI